MIKYFGVGKRVEPTKYIETRMDNKRNDVYYVYKIVAICENDYASSALFDLIENYTREHYFVKGESFFNRIVIGATATESNMDIVRDFASVVSVVKVK